MEITSTPAQRSSAYRDALFTLSASETETIDLEIREDTQNLLLGKKRLTGQTSYTVNVSNYAQRCLNVTPWRSNTTTFSYPTQRMASIRIQTENQQSTVTLSSGLEPILFFEKLSNAPDKAQITPNQGDEINMYADLSRMYADVVLDPANRNQRIRLAEKQAQIGLFSLYFSMPHLAQKIEESELGTLDEYNNLELQLITEYDELVFKRQYTLIKPTPNTLRLCWWNRYGQIDYHTFKQTETTVLIDKKRIYTSQGYKTTGCQTETRYNLISDYLNNQQMQWLHELAAAPKAWIDNGNTFLPVEILTQQVVTAGENLSQMNVLITPSQKNIFQHL